MLLVRPGRLADLDALAQMARAARPVLHSLPHDRRVLEARVALSEASFRADADVPGEEFYLFVLEDGATGRLLGTASLVAAAGYAEPFCAFRNDALIHASRELHVNRKIHALTMSHELTGKSRLAGFHVDPALRGDAAAHLVSRARMMYLATNRHRFAAEAFSLLLGVTDAQGVSPFWEAVGRKFFGRDFAEVEVASGGRSRTFIAEVMPVYPIYVPLLPEAAQRVLGEPNEHSLLAYDIHLEEGFEPDRYVDIFDAGPVLTAQVDRTACVRHGTLRTVRAARGAGGAGHGDRVARGGATHLVSAGAGAAFRCLLADLPDAASVSRGDMAPLDAVARAALGVVDGDPVYCVPLHWREAAGPRSDIRSGATR